MKTHTKLATDLSKWKSKNTFENENEKIIATIADEMRRDIDWQVMSKVMVDSGWKLIETFGKDEKTIQEWVDENFIGKYLHHKSVWLIQNPQDATTFILKWK